MVVYLLKSTVCLAAFMGFYTLFLEKEKMHYFKRFFLLGMLLFSFVIPCITFTTHVDTPVNMVSVLPAQFLETSTSTIEIGVILSYLLGGVYVLGLLFFAFRFVKNLRDIVLKIRKNPQVRKDTHTHILLREQVLPHTFLRYIFLNKVHFESQKIPKEVLLHEQVHAIQRHSIDILIMELLQIVLWFHPLVYLLKKSMKLNHEFLADQAVLSKGVPLRKYQEMLLSFSGNPVTPALANAIHYSLIKKRFTLMKTKNTTPKTWLKVVLILPLTAILLYSFSTVENVPMDETNTVEISSQDRASKKQVKEYNQLAKRYNTMDPSNLVIKKADVERLTYLYSLLSDKQKKQSEAFPNFPPEPPMPPKPMVVKKGINDRGSNVPPPPPAPEKPVKVIKGVNDKAPNIPPPPPKPSSTSKKVAKKKAYKKSSTQK